MHFLTLKEFEKKDILDILKKAEKIKRHPKRFADLLEGKSLAMIFQKTSTRTRVSFEAAMTQLGGHAQYLDWGTTNFTLGSVEDEIKCISRYVDIIMARVYDQKDLELMAKNSNVPVINALSNMYHPCQAMGDLLTINEKEGKLKNIKLVYVGDGNNVCNSLIMGGTKVGMKISVASPLNYQPKKEILDYAKKYGEVFLTTDPKKAVKDADIVYTDTWVSMGDEKETKERLKVFQPFQVNENLLYGSKALIMHCLPAHRGQEITGGVLDSKKSIVFDQAENRLHVQKAIILKLLDFY